jgi:3-oxoacid CoA-transferase subunit B
VTMEHTAKDGEHKILPACTLPLTGTRVVDLIITDLAVFEVDKKGKEPLKLLELAPGITIDELKSKTGAPFKQG